MTQLDLERNLLEKSTDKNNSDFKKLGSPKKWFRM